jgi:septum formation protein
MSLSIILASASPRRSELLRMLGVEDLKIIPSKIEEKISPGLGPVETVKELSIAKAREVAPSALPDDVVIAADTIVVLDGEILGKPRDKAEAAAMLKKLSGRSHRVFTGVAVIKGGRELVSSEETVVRFRGLSDDEIKTYVETGEPMDKAGAYGAQGKASVFVEGVRGDYFNVVGLPLCRLGKMLSELGVNLI